MSSEDGITIESTAGKNEENCKTECSGDSQCVAYAFCSGLNQCIIYNGECESSNDGVDWGC